MDSPDTGNGVVRASFAFWAAFSQTAAVYCLARVAALGLFIFLTTF